MQFKSNQIFINIKTKTMEDTIELISNEIVKMKHATNAKPLIEAFIKREKEFSTGIGQGVSIAHIRIEAVKKPTILFLKHSTNVEWNALDGNPVNLIFVIALPLKASGEHMKNLSTLSKLLLNNEFLKDITTVSTKAKALTILNTNLTKIENASKVKVTKVIKPTNKKSKMIIAAVTSCPTGIAHTYLAAEALENYAKDNNITIKVEKQGAQGTENKLSFTDIQDADYILIATGRPIDGKVRFNGKKVIEVAVAAPLKNCAKVFDQLKHAEVQHIKAAKGSNNNSSDKVTPMKAILNGLSFMIPFVVVGGLCLAISLGVSGGKAPAAGSFWNAIFNIGLGAFSLMVVILGGYIAYAIAGRAALAPAMILSFIANGATVTPKATTPNPFFFNWEALHFGVAGSDLGFFGSIAIGLMVGYAIKYWNKHISIRMPKAIKPIEPILITPLVFTITGWAIFAFAGFLPLYYLSVGFQDAINELIKHKVFWIAGILLGAMMAFDMGGPVNKIAFGLGVAYIQTDPIIMGAVAAAGAVPPIGSGLGYIFGKYVFKVKSFNNKLDKESCIPALTMGFFGVTEGAIPYAVKHPKSAIPANVMGGMVASGLAATFAITCVASHTGPVVYIVGAIGKNGITNYGYGLIYVIAMIAGILTTAMTFPILTKLFEDKWKPTIHIFGRRKKQIVR